MNKNYYTKKIRILTLFFAGLFGLCTSADAQVNVTATSGTTSATYQYLSSAFAAVNAGTHQGDILIELSASITDTGVSRLNSSGTGTASYVSVVVRPSVDAVTLSFSSLQGFGVIELNGADSITIDGDNPNTPGTNRDLTIVNTAAAATTFTSVIRVATATAALYNSANGIHLINLNLNGSATGLNVSTATSNAGAQNTTFGVVVGPNGGAAVTALASVTTPMAAGPVVNNFSVRNCAVNQCARGIAFIGNTAASSNGVTVTGNLVGDQSAVLTGVIPYTSPATTVYVKGIYVQGTTAVSIQNNSIKNIVSFVNVLPATTANVLSTGIELGTGIGAGGVLISNNTVKGVVLNIANVASAVRGISLINSSSAYVISGNDISTVECLFNGGSVATGISRPCGLFVSSAAASGTISNNKISGVINRNTGTYGVLGMWVNGGNNVTVLNNSITNINQDASGGGFFGSLQYGIHGMLVSVGTGHKIYHNSIHLSGALLGTAGAENQTFGFSIAAASVTGADVRNNIFSNVMTGGTTNNAHTAVYLPAGATSTMNLTWNNNIYFCGPNPAMHGVAQVGIVAGTGLYTHANYKAYATTPANNFRSYVNGLKTTPGNDSASFAKTEAAPFLSSTDLHITPNIKSVIESTGATLAGIVTDMDGDARPGPAGSVNGGGTHPDIGADEADLIYDVFSMDSAVVDQLTDIAAPGETQRIVKVRIYYSGSVTSLGTVSPFVLQSLKLNTSGSTNPSDIVNARTYYTGSSSVFSTATPFGTAVASPLGTFYTTGSQILTQGVNYIWLTYELSSSATLGHVVDAVLDSVQISNVNYSPLNGDPAGNVLITSPMTYLSSAAIQPNTNTVAQGSTNQMVMGVQVITSALGSPSGFTSIDVSTAGTTSVADIRNLKVWYTGNSNVFATNTQFGTTVAVPAATQTISGVQALSNDTNYFWITYDIAPAAVAGNVIDAECTSVTVAGTAHAPSLTSPAGNRRIRVEYCTPVYSDAANACIQNVFINNVSTTGAITNVTNTGSGCAGGTQYTYYPSHVLTVAQNSSFTLNVNALTGNASAGWIDYNHDGVYGTNELIFVESSGSGLASVNVTVPCSALPGTTRMRVRNSLDFIPNNPCLDMELGEAEDYAVEIIAAPLVYSSSTAIQQTGLASPGASDRAVLRIPVKTTGCSSGTITSLSFNTTGTTNTGDITSAKLYQTGNNPVFNTTKLIATIPSPSSSFVFNITDTLVTNDTTNYWLAYDVSMSASTGNTLDAQLDGMQVLGGFQMPTVSAPAGDITVNTPMAYIGSDVVIASPSKVGKGTANNAVIAIRVMMSSSGAPLNLTQLDFNTNGTTDTANIRNIKVWYTGNNPGFTTGLQFGNTLAYLPGTTSFIVTGNQTLTNDTNYFWLSYDIDAAAAVANVVDAECGAITITGTVHTPVVTAPAGNREIRNEYCTPVHTGYGPCISNVTFNTLNNSLGGACALPAYTNFPVATATTTVQRNSTYTLSVTTDAAAIVSVWIDFNDNGAFEATEWRQVVVTSTGGTPATIPMLIPCDAKLGELRMRIRARGASNVNAAANFCTSFGTGESEDYTITIIDNPAAYTFSTAVQQTGTVSKNMPDRPVLRIPVHTKGCGIGLVERFYFTTGVSSNPAADITAAKLYVTGNSSTFSTAKLVGTVPFPNGVFSFTVADTLLNNDTTNYWLAYDISSGAVVGDVVDAIFDSVRATGISGIPVVSDPAGFVLVDVAMSYVSSTVIQNVLKVGAGSVNNDIVKLQIITSSTGSVVNLNSLDISTAGTTSLADITNLKVWYTGISNVFAATTQFGTTIPVPSATQTITGAQTLLNDTNYFWVTYDVLAVAPLSNVVDAEITSLTMAGVAHVPAVTSPTGNRLIRTEYCAATSTNGTGDGDFIGLVQLGSINNATIGSPTPFYTYYNGSNTNLTTGNFYTITIGAGTETANGVAAWIDYNNDGIFATDEKLGEVRVGASPATASFRFAVPLNATAGVTRLRVREVFNVFVNINPCNNSNFGEVEDYNVTILPAGAPVIYTWNQAGSASYGVAANWTPVRNEANLQDQLVFNGGGSVIVTDVVADRVTALTIDNNTHVTFVAATGATSFGATGNLNLLSGRLTLDNAQTFTLGQDIANIGTLTGSGRIEGGFRRWVNAATNNYEFPLLVEAKNRNVMIGYTTPVTAGGTLTARFITGAPGDNGLPLTEGAVNVTKAGIDGVWSMVAADGLTGGIYTASLTAGGFTNVLNYTSLVMIKRNNNASAWLLNGTHVTTSGSNAEPVLSRTGMSGFSEFGIGGDSLVNPLPVKLLMFTANNSKGNVMLDWATSSEVNNKGFEVERSVNGRLFEHVRFVRGAGNSQVKQEYTLTDYRAFEITGARTLFYRLKQIDEDGEYQYSPIVSVTSEQELTESISAYPNPFSQTFTVSVQASEATTGNIQVFDMQGRLIADQVVTLKQGVTLAEVSSLHDVPTGIYMVKVICNNTVHTLKMIKTVQ